MNIKDLKSLWLSDLYRYSDNTGMNSFFKSFILIPGYKYSFYMRLCNYLYSKNSHFFSLLFRIVLLHYEYKFGISIPFSTKIGKGFYIGHFGGIVVSSKAVIGDNCNISQNVTIGVSNRGKNKGYPTIGNEVYIGSGAKIFGSITIGNNVAIGANCVVTKDVPDNAVIVGVPGKVISYQGAKHYVNRVYHAVDES